MTELRRASFAGLKELCPPKNRASFFIRLISRQAGHLSSVYILCSSPCCDCSLLKPLLITGILNTLVDLHLVDVAGLLLLVGDAGRNRSV